MSYTGHKTRNDMRIKGKDAFGNEVDMKVSQGGNLMANLDKVERHGDTDGALTGVESESLRVAGVNPNGQHKHVKVTTDGITLSHPVVIRQSSNEEITIPANTVGYGSTIAMGDNNFIAFCGNLSTTAGITNSNNKIRLEYSPNGTDWFRGAEDNSKVILVNSGVDKGDFYESQRIITKYVRISRWNGSSSDETIKIHYTRA